jgi:hypothetical protein
MKYVSLFGFLALSVLMLIALVPGGVSQANVEAAAHPAVEGIKLVGTPGPARERPNRSYPAPTGYPAFRRYYQKRCYPGCHYGSAAPAPTSTPHTPPPALSAQTRERPNRSYPAPTGYPAFRRYYQKRCYPGCHYGGDVVTPVATKIHP